MSQTLTARRTNLRRANRVRLGIAAVKRELAADELELIDALYDQRAQPMRVGDLLGARPRFGPVRVDLVCTCLMISSQKRVGALTARQKLLVAQAGEGTAADVRKLAVA